MNRILKEFLNSNFGTRVKTAFTPGALPPIPIDSATHTTPNNEDGWFYQLGANGQHNYFKYNDSNSAVEAYKKCPPVAAIINRKSQAYTNGKTYILNSRGKEAVGTQADQLRKLLRKPNPLQSWKQFEAQLYIYKELFGFSIILPIKPLGFNDNLDATSMWNIPASWVDIEATKERFTKLGGEAVSEVVIRFNGNEIVLKVKDLIIVKDLTPSFTTLTFPASKLQALEMPINNIIGSFDSRNVLINYRGALGILSQDPGRGQFVSIPMTEDQRRDLQADFRRYGLRKSQFQVILTTAALKWQQMGYPTKELMLLEEVVESTKSICDGLNYPPHLLGLIDPTFNNQKEAKKGLYEDSIIPDAENIYEQLTAAFGLERYNLRLDKDYNHLSALQEDKVNAATARKSLDEAMKIEYDAGLITFNQWLEALGYDPIPDGNIRKTDTDKGVPLAVTIGVGGIQGLIEILTAPGMSPEARQASLEIVFGLQPADAERMSQSNTTGNETAGTTTGTTTTGTGTQQTNE